jgi:hypothetical protein
MYVIHDPTYSLHYPGIWRAVLPSLWQWLLWLSSLDALFADCDITLFLPAWSAMTEGDNIPLRVYLEERFNRLEKDIEKQFTMRDVQSEKALMLQAKEYERRLESLNHEADQLKSMQRTYVSQEVYDEKMKNMDSELRLLRSFKDNMEGRMIGYSAIAFILALATSIALHFIH